MGGSDVSVFMCQQGADDCQWLLARSNEVSQQEATMFRDLVPLKFHLKG